MKKDISQLHLAEQLTTKTQQLCIGLEDGDAEILELVTPTTAELLKWWFMSDAIDSRGNLNFHAGQKQAILNAIVAHEVLRAPTLKNLYEQAAPTALLEGNRLSELADVKHQHPKYCLKMATGTGKTWVMQALMVWQLLNKNALVSEGVDEADELHRLFTRQFLIVAPGLIVYDRLLDAFCGKLVAGGNGARDFATSDVHQFSDLFIPEMHREAVFAFVRGNVCAKDEIGLKTTGNGMIAIANWHLLSDTAVEEFDEDEIIAQGADIDPAQVVAQVLPLTPGRNAGNALDVLDKRYARGNVLNFLANLPDLMVFNDEAHHIHEVKKDGEATEVEWQKSLSKIAERKGARFVQVDFSATPYNDVGGGAKKRKVYFPHIIVDFDLKTAMRSGLVKSLVLDKRVQLGAQPLEELDFKAIRDEGDKKAVELSDGQRVMLRAGLMQLKKLETEFAKIDETKRPKMLVVCEDTTVSPLVTEFLQGEGLSEDEVMAVDSGKKAELTPREWEPLREKLFNVDNHAAPRVIVSVLMLREGFDVNNICVIVPLRSSQAQILLEQTIGRGLRLMWRDAEYDDAKFENRSLLKKGKAPSSMIDVLTIVEHPAFESFYQDLMDEGLAGVVDDDDTDPKSAGDLLKVGLRDDYAQYDFHMPFIVHEAEDELSHAPINVAAMPAYTAMDVASLKGLLGKGDTFRSHDLQTATVFGDYRVNGVVMNVNGYNDYLTRMGRRIAQALSSSLPKGNKIASHVAHPYLHTGSHEMIGALDEYIREMLFGGAFNPMADENWRVLLIQDVMDFIVQRFALALHESESIDTVGETEVHFRALSETDTWVMRESKSLVTSKSIYERLPFPAHSGGLEQAFMEWADRDTSVAAFCKINENKHDFVRLRYLKTEGLPAFYYPDFLVRVVADNGEHIVYMVETKAQQQVSHPNVQRKRQAALNWCNRINTLPADKRERITWKYVLLGEAAFYDWRDKGATLSGLLNYGQLQEKNKTQQEDMFGNR